MSVDLDGVFYVAQQAARRMLAGSGGVILNMGSTSGMNGYPRYADYNAAKAGVIELTRTMALELAPTIRVIAVCPGYVWTPMQEAEYTPEMKAAVDAKIPLRRHATPGRDRGALRLPGLRRGSVHHGASGDHRRRRNRRRSGQPLEATATSSLAVSDSRPSQRTAPAATPRRSDRALSPSARWPSAIRRAIRSDWSTRRASPGWWGRSR